MLGLIDGCGFMMLLVIPNGVAPTWIAWYIVPVLRLSGPHRPACSLDNM